MILLSSEEITPGWNKSKTFSVKNESNGTFNYNITIKGLVNTFVTEGFFKYKITSTNGGYNMEDYVDIPKSDTAQDVVIAYDIDIEKDVTQEYQIEFVYEDSETIDQSEDMGKVFNGTLAIEEGTVNPNIKYNVTLNVENATIEDTNIKETLKKGSVEFNVTPNEGYTLGTTVTCDNNASGVIENGKVTISNVTTSTICSLTIIEKQKYTVNVSVTGGSASPSSRTVYSGENISFSISASIGYSINGASVSGTGCSLSGSILYVNDITNNTTCYVTLLELYPTIQIISRDGTTAGFGEIDQYPVNTTTPAIFCQNYNQNKFEIREIKNVASCRNGETSSLIVECSGATFIKYISYGRALFWCPSAGRVTCYISSACELID